MAMINEKVAQALGLPVPMRGEPQTSYVWRACLGGFVINTRQARLIGIANLHSVASALRNSHRLPISRERCAVIDPATGKLDRRCVLRVWCEPADIAEHQAKKSALIR